MFNNRAKRLSTKGKLFAIAALFGIGTAVTSLQQWSETHAFMINATDSLPNWAFLVESGRFPDRGARIADAIDRLAKEGRIVPHIDRRLPLTSWREAFETMQRGEIIGKLVLEP